MQASSSRFAALAAVATLVFAACGGKEIDGIDAGDATPAPTGSSPESGPPIDAGGRTCPPNCTVGHECCIGGCGGLPAAMPNSCCSCLPNETSSLLCTNGKCGG